MPGDDFLPDARAEATHEVDIDAPPEGVWPWLVQMGRGRAGWYSWDLLDNGGVPSAYRIIDGLQTLRAGDVLPIKRSGTEGFSVLVLEPASALVLGDASLLPGRPAPPHGTPRGTWAFALEPARSTGTHLTVRVRVEYEPGFAAALLRPMVGGLHEIMQRKQLRTLKDRAEARLDEPAKTKLGALVGSGDRIGLLALPFSIVGLALNVLRPSMFSVGGPPAALKAISTVLLVSGITIWIWSVALILRKVPRQELITTGPYAFVRHPLYTGVALLALPSIGFLLDTWLGALIGIVLYAGSRMFSPEEEKALSKTFGDAWDEYCKRVKIPWL